MLYLQLIKKLERHSGFGNTHFSQEFELEGKENQSPVYRNLYPNCEVMLSKHGLYPVTGGRMLPGKDPREELDVITESLGGKGASIRAARCVNRLLQD